MYNYNFATRLLLKMRCKAARIHPFFGYKWGNFLKDIKWYKMV